MAEISTTQQETTREILTPDTAIAKLRELKINHDAFYFSQNWLAMETILRGIQTVAFEPFPRFYYNEVTGKKQQLPIGKARFIFRNSNGENVAYKFYACIAADIATELKEKTGADLYFAGSLDTRDSTFPIAQNLQKPVEFKLLPNGSFTDGKNDLKFLSDLDLAISGVSKDVFFREAYPIVVKRLEQINASLPAEVRFNARTSMPVYEEKPNPHLVRLLPITVGR